MLKLFRWLAVSLAMVLLFVANSCRAGGCTARDAWTGQDKNLHAVGSAAVAAAFTAGTGNAWKGFGAGAFVAIGHEVWDTQRAAGHCTLQDAVVGVLGAAAGAAFTNFGMKLERDRVQVSYTWELR